MWFENLKINLKIFLKYGGINRFTRKSTSILERYKVLTSCKMYPWSKFWRTRVAISMFVYHFWSWHGGYDIFKNRTAEKGGVDFEIEGSGTSAYFCWGPEKISCNIACFFIAFSVKKALLTFIPWLLNSFDLPNYGSKTRKRNTLRTLLKCLEEEKVLEAVLLGRGQIAYLRKGIVLGKTEMRNYAN